MKPGVGNDHSSLAVPDAIGTLLNSVESARNWMFPGALGGCTVAVNESVAPTSTGVRLAASVDVTGIVDWTFTVRNPVHGA